MTKKQNRGKTGQHVFDRKTADKTGVVVFVTCNREVSSVPVHREDWTSWRRAVCDLRRRRPATWRSTRTRTSRTPAVRRWPWTSCTSSARPCRRRGSERPAAASSPAYDSRDSSRGTCRDGVRTAPPPLRHRRRARPTRRACSGRCPMTRAARTCRTYRRWSSSRGTTTTRLRAATPTPR